MAISIIILAVLIIGGLIGGAIAMGMREDKKNEQPKIVDKKYE